MQPEVDQVVTVFRNRVRPEALTRYAQELAVVAELARSMPGFVETKTFVADDGERATIVTFADEVSHAGWRAHLRHHQAQRAGVADYYATYTIAVGTTSHASAFTRPDTTGSLTAPVRAPPPASNASHRWCR